METETGAPPIVVPEPGPDNDTVLVACPTYSGHAGILDEYLEAYQAFRWQRRNLLMVDTTDDGGEYARSISQKVAEPVGR